MKSKENDLFLFYHNRDRSGGLKVVKPIADCYSELHISRCNFGLATRFFLSFFASVDRLTSFRQWHDFKSMLNGVNKELNYIR